MPFVKLTQAGVSLRRRRFLISGGPNKWKTTALLTLPKPLAIVSSPGEKGYDTIPLDEPDIHPYIWEDTVDPEKMTVVQSARIIAEVRKVVVEQLANPKIQAVAFDGFHKFYEYILDDITGGAYFAGQDFEKTLYGPAGHVAWEFLSLLSHNAKPVVAVTTWDAAEPDRQKKPGEERDKIPSHTYPDLPGRSAKRIMGEFSVVVHQSIGRLKPNDPADIGLWQTRPYGEVWGCGIKGPKAIVERIPTFIPAQYAAFEAIWDYAAKLAAQPASAQEEKK